MVGVAVFTQGGIAQYLLGVILTPFGNLLVFPGFVGGDGQKSG